jgi:ribosome maturation factor RimP
LTELTTEIEGLLNQRLPELEVLLVEVVAGDTLRVYIDHSDGVTLAQCAEVTEQLSGYRDRYTIEVTSPGDDRPLTKPQHFRRYLGRRARLRLREARDGRSSLTGELVGASDSEVTVSAGGGVVSIPYEQIARSNLVPGD